jgi:hypothetical protein
MDTQADRPTSTDEIAAINRGLLRSFSRAFLPSIATVFSLVAITSFIAFAIIAMNRESGAWGQILGIHLVQIGAGLVLGLFCLFLGAMMCWFGITGTFTLNAEGAGSKLSLQGTHVGIVLLVGGLLVLGLSLHKSITANESWKPSPGGSAAASPTTSSKSLITADDKRMESADAEATRLEQGTAARIAMKAVEQNALSNAVDIATNSAKQIDNVECRTAALRVVQALKDYANKRAEPSP